MTTDIIDLLAGVKPGSELDAIRALRPQARENAQRSFTELLEPDDPGSFPLADRYAVAAFVAGLHGFDEATRFYADLLGDEAPESGEVILRASQAQRATGPVGLYREPGLAAESTTAPVFAADADLTARVGRRLAAGLEHAHLLVFRPREARADALRALVSAGWDADAIVTLSQLVAFLAFQLRLAWGLRALGSTPLREETGRTHPSSAHDSDLDLQGATR